MNHKVRALGIVTRAFPRVITTKGGIRIDMTGWHESVAQDLEKGLREAERDGHRRATNTAANTAGDLHGCPRLEITRAILDGHKQFVLEQRRRYRRG